MTERKKAVWPQETTNSCDDTATRSSHLLEQMLLCSCKFPAVPSFLPFFKFILVNTKTTTGDIVVITQ